MHKGLAIDFLVLDFTFISYGLHSILLGFLL